LRGRNPDAVARELIQNLKNAPRLREARLLIMMLNDALVDRGTSPELEALCEEAKQVLLEMDIGAKPVPEKE
jgi:hypothetical protein